MHHEGELLKLCICLDVHPASELLKGLILPFLKKRKITLDVLERDGTCNMTGIPKRKSRKQKETAMLLFLS